MHFNSRVTKLCRAAWSAKASRAVSCAALVLFAHGAFAELIHPGAFVTDEQIARTRARIANNEEPWSSALAWLQAHPHAQDSYTPIPYPNVYQGSYAEGDVGGWRMMMDGRAVYLHALLFVLTDDQHYADRAIAFANAWSSTLQSVSGVNAKLIGAAAFSGFANGGELLAHSNSGWAPADRAQFETMLRDIAYPLIQDFQPNYNGNWDAIITNSMMAIGVFLDDQAIFDRAVDYYRNGHGNGSLGNYVRTDGTTQETTRDSEHENMGIAGLTGSATIAWNQGIDLFGYLDNRLLIGAEGVADRVLADNQQPYPCWEMLYAHYNGRLGLPMPNVERVFANGYSQVRPEDYGLFQGVGYGTLTAAGAEQIPVAESSVGGFRARFAP